MRLLALQSLRRQRYVVIAAAALTLLALGRLLMGVRVQTPMSRSASFWWPVTTGSVLFGCIAYQWSCLRGWAAT